MSDLISRQAAIDITNDLIISVSGYEQHNHAVNSYSAELMKLPPAEPERKKGEWIWVGEEPFERCRCSECGYYRQLKIPEPDYFCPNCGADMREGG